MRLTVRQTLRNPVHSLGLEDVVLVRHHRLPAVLVHLLRGDFLAVGEPCRRRRPLDVGCAAARPVRERAVDGAERGEPPVARVEEVVHEVAAEAHPERAEQSRAEGVLRVRVAVPPPVPVPVLVKISEQVRQRRPAEELPEYVLRVSEREEAEAPEVEVVLVPGPAAAAAVDEALFAVLVVHSSLFIIGQDFVRLGDLLELLRRVFYVVLVLVGVPFQGELAVPETHISPSNSPQSHNTHAFLISAVVAFFDTSRTL
jgi:hypothetical protein